MQHLFKSILFHLLALAGFLNGRFILVNLSEDNIAQTRLRVMEKPKGNDSYQLIMIHIAHTLTVKPLRTSIISLYLYFRM